MFSGGSWPIRPSSLEQWLALVHQPIHEKELMAIRRSIERGTPYGRESWSAAVAKQLGLEHAFHRRGRPSSREP